MPSGLPHSGSWGFSNPALSRLALNERFAGLSRLRTTMSRERTRLVNRLHKTLEDTHLKLSSVLTDSMGQTGRHILGAILRGEEDPAVLADLALRRAASKRDALALALRGRVSDHHRLLLRELLEMIQHHDQAMYRLDQEIEERLRPYEPLIQRQGAHSWL